MPKANNELGVVVNYYTNYSSVESHEVLVAATGLSLRLLKMNPSVGTVILVDGSEESDEKMKEVCEDIGVRYYHDGKKISYAKAYNIGWQSLTEPYIGLMANDIVPFPLDTIQILLDWLKRPDIGCVFPYLTSNSLRGGETQRPGFWGRGSRTCELTSMTLNLNLFKRSVLEKIGGLDENYLFGYAEPILLIKIRSLGFRVVLVGDTRAFHYEKLTKSLGESTLAEELYLEDSQRWYKEYPRYASKRGIANLNLWRQPFSTTLIAKTFWWISYHIPFSKPRRALIILTMWLEPLLTRYPARYRKFPAADLNRGDSES